MILGMSFRESTSHFVYLATNSITFPSVRSAYMLVNFGDFIDGKQDKVADPYVQLLPTTDDLTEAHNDFVQVRLKGIDSTKDQSLLDTFTPSGPPDVGTSNSSGGFSNWLYKHKTILIAVGASLGGLLLISIVALCCCRRRRKAGFREKGGKKGRFMQGVPVGGKGGYRQVHDHVPPATYLPSYSKV